MTEPLIVSLDQFADLCGITSETMRVHIGEVEGQPDWLVERGGRGRPYRIESVGGVEWWKARREGVELADAERRAQLSQMRLDLVGPSGEGAPPLTMSGRQRSEEIEAALKELQFRRAKGELMVVSELQHELLAAAVELRRRLMLTPGEFAIVAGLDPDLVRPLEGIIGRALDAFVASLAPVGLTVTNGERP